MAFALHFRSHPWLRSHPWHPISTAPCNRGIELRVREGTAISTLEFPCRQSNAGDWINCDFGTPINIQPVEWRAWQHSHAPQPQSPKLNSKGRRALPPRGHRGANRSTPVKLSDRPVRRAKSMTAMACALIGIVVVAAAAASFTRISAWALPIGLTAPTTPAAAVSETAIAAADGARTEDSCQEFGSAFLNSACLTRHKRFAGRRTHRVATFVIGRSEAQQEPLSR
jgi:hypothetical protein